MAVVGAVASENITAHELVGEMVSDKNGGFSTRDGSLRTYHSNLGY